ncbi:hypothetical protein ACFVYV_15485 [Streptomyces mirabilis]|uniref:hypothetical protein n=1 Tax=Streptomyces mirabilis TaxID=68239 RepID=UPI0036DC2C2B
MRRRVRLSRLAVLTAIAAGPVALGVAITSAPTTVGAAPAAKPAAVRTTAAAADPAGCAQLFVSAWLLSSASDVTSAQARLAQSMAPDVELPAPAAGAQSKSPSVIAVRSAQCEGGTWSVTVAAHYADGSVRHYAVRSGGDRRQLHAGRQVTVDLPGPGQVRPEELPDRGRQIAIRDAHAVRRRRHLGSGRTGHHAGRTCHSERVAGRVGGHRGSSCRRLAATPSSSRRSR